MKSNYVFLLALLRPLSTLSDPNDASGLNEVNENAKNRQKYLRRESPSPSAKRIIVKYSHGNKTEFIKHIKEANYLRNDGDMHIEINYDFEEIDTFVITASAAEIDQLKKGREIESIEEDVPRYLSRVEGSTHRRSLTTFWESRPYGVSMVEAPSLWERGATGQGVKICVIDSGIDVDHPDFVSSRFSGSGIGWYDDRCGHGTHVSGTIVAEDDSKGVIGVAPNAEIHSVRVFADDCGYTFSSQIYKAALTCKDNGANIINMSLGGKSSSTFEESVFNGLFYNDNILLVAAAGNDGSSAFNYPASYSSVMSVAAVNRLKWHADFSQYNSQVDIAAPGQDVLSTLPADGCKNCGWGWFDYGTQDGTSMATPHVSGVAALLLSAFPGTSAVQLRSALQYSAEDRGSSGWDAYFGHGVVRADAAYQVLVNSRSSVTSKAMAGIGCTDTSGWHGPIDREHTCEWYARENHCSTFGNLIGAGMKTAEQACCVCGGGSR